MKETMVRKHKKIPKYLWGILIGISICILMAAFFSIHPIQAYFEDREELINTVVIGKNEIVVEEIFEEPEKGKKTVKEPKAKNTGTVDCYVRAKVVVSDSRVSDYLTYYYDTVSGFNTADWIAEEDGWMYYHSRIKKGELTTPVFQHIALSNSIPDDLLDFSIDVIFESVQSEGFYNAKKAFESLSIEGGVCEE